MPENKGKRIWTRNELHALASSSLKDYRFIVVSNRQPVSHIYKKGKIETQKGVGGVATALEPVVRACNGTWIAMSDGDADKSVCDENDRVKISGGKGEPYTLRRLFISKEEKEGYYYGYANSVLWPMCHTCFQKPKFNKADWDMYCQVNERFAEAIFEEIREEKAFIWIQDYHFALLAKILKDRAPKQLITSHFWHIPFPTYEVFRICPQQKEILEGLLANDLLAFHLRYHCHNFLDVVDREMVCRIDRERQAVITDQGETLIRSYPISIDYEEILKAKESDDVLVEEKRLKEEYLLEDKKVIVGLDRIDYTKGLLERLMAFDLLLRQYPTWKEKVVFLQFGVITRLHLEEYKKLNDDINKVVEQVNWFHGTNNWRPVIFIRQNLEFKNLLALYRLGDVGIVSSLHDGMNLVAKEYVSTCGTEKGMIVLSEFTGASRELTEALLVNPYDLQSFAEALDKALSMAPQEKAKKNLKMRDVIAENNIYRWAGKTLSDLLKIEFAE